MIRNDVALSSVPFEALAKRTGKTAAGDLSESLNTRRHELSAPRIMSGEYR